MWLRADYQVAGRRHDWVGRGPGESGASEGCPHHRFRVPWLESIPIAVSNNIDEQELARLSQKVGGAGAAQRVARRALGLQMLAELISPPPQGSEVNVIGIGTSVVTCPRQPSLGCVYKVERVRGPVGMGWGWTMGPGRRVQLAQHPVPVAGVRGRPAADEADRGPREADIAWKQGCLPAPGLRW